MSRKAAVTCIARAVCTSLSWRYLKQFKDENGRWIPEKENEREDVHTALAMQVTAAFRDMGVTGTLTHEVKTDLRKSLEKKCSNEKAKRIRLEKREAFECPAS